MLLSELIDVSAMPLNFHYSKGMFFQVKKNTNLKNSINFSPPNKPISKIFNL